jgi:hypothetical protein
MPAVVPDLWFDTEPSKPRPTPPAAADTRSRGLGVPAPARHPVSVPQAARAPGPRVGR